MRRTWFSTEPQAFEVVPHPGRPAEVFVRRNIKHVEGTDEPSTEHWEADEVYAVGDYTEASDPDAIWDAMEQPTEAERLSAVESDVLDAFEALADIYESMGV